MGFDKAAKVVVTCDGLSGSYKRCTTRNAMMHGVLPHACKVTRAYAIPRCQYVTPYALMLILTHDLPERTICIC